MNKFAIALAALGIFASGALASQRNHDPETSFAYGSSTSVTVSKPLAVSDEGQGNAAFQQLNARIMDRQNGDRG